MTKYARTLIDFVAFLAEVEAYKRIEGRILHLDVRLLRTKSPKQTEDRCFCCSVKAHHYDHFCPVKVVEQFVQALKQVFSVDEVVLHDPELEPYRHNIIEFEQGSEDAFDCWKYPVIKGLSMSWSSEPVAKT